MTVPAPAPGYLEEAAAQLRKARDANEQRLEHAATMHSGQRQEAAQVTREVNARRMEIAEAFIRIAALEADLPPCCFVVRPGGEQQ